MKPHILLTADVYLPGYLAGGPVRSITGLVESLGDEFEISIVTSDRDLNSSSPYANVQLDAWNKVGKARVYYMRPGLQTIGRMARLLRETPHDLVYLNSYFSPKFSIIPLILRWLGLVPQRPVLIAPRGEFSTGAYHLKKWKKQSFTWISKMLSIHQGVHWHASTNQEAEDIRRVMCVQDAEVSIARNLIALSKVRAGVGEEAKPTGGPVRVCFLSRISRTKNLDYALDVLKNVRIPVLFSIYGPKEDLAYWQECERLIAAIPNHVEVRYKGTVAQEKVQDVIALHDVFFFPTRGENFGHVFLEAWSAGVPVITSDQTPWRGLMTQGVGWDLPLADPRRFVDVIESFAVGSSDCGATQLRCAEFASRHATDSLAVQANRDMFRAVLRQCNS